MNPSWTSVRRARSAGHPRLCRAGECHGGLGTRAAGRYQRIYGIKPQGRRRGGRRRRLRVRQHGLSALQQKQGEERRPPPRTRTLRRGKYDSEPHEGPLDENGARRPGRGGQDGACERASPRRTERARRRSDSRWGEVRLSRGAARKGHASLARLLRQNSKSDGGRRWGYSDGDAVRHGRASRVAHTHALPSVVRRDRFLDRYRSRRPPCSRHHPFLPSRPDFPAARAHASSPCRTSRDRQRGR
jgi:hypothetical protein